MRVYSLRIKEEMIMEKHNRSFAAVRQEFGVETTIHSIYKVCEDDLFITVVF